MYLNDTEHSHQHVYYIYCENYTRFDLFSLQSNVLFRVFVTRVKWDQKSKSITPSCTEVMDETGSDEMQWMVLCRRARVCGLWSSLCVSSVSRASLNICQCRPPTNSAGAGRKSEVCGTNNGCSLF